MVLELHDLQALEADQQHRGHGRHRVHGQDVGRLQSVLPERREQAEGLLGRVLGQEELTRLPSRMRWRMMEKIGIIENSRITFR